MKKVILIIFMIKLGCLGLYGQVHTIYISGQVKSDTGKPVPNYIITIECDSSENSAHYGYFSDVYTNSNGVYSCKITNIPDTAKSLDFYISLLDCFSDKIIYTVHYTAGDTVLYGNFIICYEQTVNCIANFYSKTDSTKQNTVDFFDNSQGGDILKWKWSFGDGTYSTEQNPIHTFKDTNTYSVCLIIYSFPTRLTTDTCISAAFCKDVKVNKADTIPECNASFVFKNDTTDTTNLNCSFTNTSIVTNLLKNEEVKYLWQFGDGQTSTDKDPIHVYLKKGLYDICLTISVVLLADTSKIYCRSTTCKNNIAIGNMHKYLIGGNIYEGNLPSQSGGKAKIYRYNSNMTVMQDTLMEYHDTAYYNFYPLWEGNYIVKILPDNNTDFPTYFGNKLLWNNSQIIDLDKNHFTEDIQLVQENPNTGTGEICGTVILKDTLNKNEEIEVLLFDKDMNPISYRLADVNRKFDFDNITFGTYNLYTEITGWTGTYTSASIDVNNPTACGLELLANPTGVNEQYSALRAQCSVFPNPTDDKLNININLPYPETMSFDIFNIVGKSIGTEGNSIGTQHVVSLQKGNNIITLDVSNITGGIYFLKVTSFKNAEYVFKKFIKY